MKIIPFTILIISAFLINGCATLLDQTVYVQNLNTKGPVHLPPLSIVDDKSQNKVVISPRLFFNSYRLRGSIYHSPVNSYSDYQLDTIHNGSNVEYRESVENKNSYNKNNIIWDLPMMSGGIDFQFPLVKNALLNLGVSYSEYNSFSLLGGTAGFCFTSVQENYSAAFSLGLHAQQMYYDAFTVVQNTIGDYNSGTMKELGLFHDVNKDFRVNAYSSFMLNYFYKYIKFNMAVSLFSQTVFNIHPEKLDNNYYPLSAYMNPRDAQTSAYAVFLALTPGVYTYLTDIIRLSGSVNCIYELGKLKSQTPQKVLFIPSVKFDFIF